MMLPPEVIQKNCDDTRLIQKCKTQNVGNQSQNYLIVHIFRPPLQRLKQTLSVNTYDKSVNINVK